MKQHEPNLAPSRVHGTRMCGCDSELAKCPPPDAASGAGDRPDTGTPTLITLLSGCLTKGGTSDG